MLRFLSLLLLAGLVFACAAPAATACINDSELPTHEKEFKSDYLKQAPSGPEYTPGGKSPQFLLVSGLGIVTLTLGTALGVVVAVRRR